MDLKPMKRARKERTQHELTLLEGRIKAWLTRRQNTDTRGFHETQLNAVDAMLCGAVTALMTNLRSLDLDQSPEYVYQQCRDFDEAIVWLERLWDFIRDKFDQRDDQNRFGPLLAAADEVVWSCYRQPFIVAQARDKTIEPKPVPLAFIEAQYSPGAIQSDKPLRPSLRLTASSDIDFLDPYLEALPISLVRLPPWCVDAPWWLVYIGHEIGHHIQHDLKLVKTFREGLEGVAEIHHLSDSNVEAWGRWGEEIFADVFSVITMGSWAVWAMVEAEWDTADAMVKHTNRYPAPVIRLALMARAAEELGVDYGDALAGLELEAIASQHPRSKRDWQVVADAVDFALGNLGNLGTLKGLYDLETGEGESRKLATEAEKAMARWALHLRSTGPIPRVPEPGLKTARQITSGALCAWYSTMKIDDKEQRREHRRDLAARTRETLVANAPAGHRSVTPDKEMAEIARTLAKDLLQKSREQRT